MLETFFSLISVLLIAVRYVQLPPGHASFDGRTTVSVTEVSVLQARVCGTACHRTDEKT